MDSPSNRDGKKGNTPEEAAPKTPVELIPDDTPKRKPAASKPPKSPKSPAAKAKGNAKGKSKAKPKTPAKKPASKVLKGSNKGSKGGKGAKGAKPGKGGAKQGKGANQEDSSSSSAVPMKRPSANQNQESKDENKQAKKDAWKAGIMEEKVEPPQKKGQEEGEEEVGHFDEDPEVLAPVEASSGAETRDRSKHNKFLQMLSSEHIPEYIAHEWEASKSMKSGKRDRQSLIVNSLFDRSSAGKLILNDQKVVFMAMKTNYNEKVKKEQCKTLPRMLFMGKFNLTAEMLQEGLEAGEFEAVETPSGVQYGWKSHTHTKKEAERNEMGWKGQKEGGKGDMSKYNQLAGTWKSGIKGLPSSRATGSATPLAILDQQAPLSEEQWQQAQAQLNQAINAYDKMETTALQLLQAIGPDNKNDPVYAVLLLGCAYC